ncbi:hypothetical protein COY52_09180 [Candidatus Desantisbacteria bacterium CG_4_10_14_0_8_um_filter_48_22]|uniref:Uncharacterized protein n=1 Tax=Candidatus Desantisbacteria bacterium CG_4_10_14_0_8_um_filter_48_22 TaxID=1974543 RepID=A0A2M7S837_9BACT|nr:MAG: hypothetical protein COY52_09180 [Candidatus Desantisbacteria bacterium CG_4_10_14_0_8_um_filter_48_22]
MYISTRAAVSGISWDNNKLDFSLSFPEGESGYAVIACIDAPDTVVLNGNIIEKTSNLKKSDKEGWRYQRNWLEVKILSSKATLEIRGAKYKYVTSVRKPASSLQ